LPVPTAHRFSVEPDGATEKLPMIPAPNVLAGVVIGIATNSWLTVLGVAAVWPALFCMYVAVAERARREATVAVFAARVRHLLMSSTALTFFAIEFRTALCTAVPVAVLAHAVKALVS